jgi:regulator of sirC expression with transglutaminase-like and TPR domain
MLDLVLERRTGLPILLSVVYVEAARRAGIALAGVGLPGHFVVGHFGAEPPILLDPFSRGRISTGEARVAGVRPWGAHEIALRMLNNLIGSYAVRGDLAHAIHASELRLALPVDDTVRAALRAEVKALRARLN